MRTPSCSFFVVLAFLGTLQFSALARAGKFKLQCEKLPFPIATHARIIDQQCEMTGDQSTGPKALQNSLKNNLCVTGPLTTLQQADFLNLQHIVQERGIKFGHSGFGNSRREFFPDDRSELSSLINVNGRNVGESSHVQFVAYMDHPYYSDVSNGESVNCDIPGNETNDIHINLVQRPAPKAPKKNDPNHEEIVAARDRALCHSITAEVIPHFRPIEWEEVRLRKVADDQRPVRISGQLFFDASHYPCDGDEPHHGESLRRASIWEIHPVYSIDVCKSKKLQECDADDDASWTPLDKWITH